MSVKMVGRNLDEIIRDFNREIEKIEGDVQKGLSLGGLEIKGESMQRTPVDTGNLKNSHYMVSAKGGAADKGGGFNTVDKSGEQVAREHDSHVQAAAGEAHSSGKPLIELGCTAFYAEQVHEDLEARHTTGQAKFLENAIRNKINQLPGYIRRFAKR